jgi:hypothetical protein
VTHSVAPAASVRPAEAKRQHRPRWTERILLLVGGIIAALLVTEGVLRAAGFSYTTRYIGEPNSGWSLQPGAALWWRGEGVPNYVRINSQGMRDWAHTVQKPPDTFRIAVLGDSYAEAMTVPMQDTFWAIMERDLPRACRALAGKRVEALNFGVSGYGTAQELITLRHKVWKYSPDAVLLLFTTGNDVRNNSKALQQDPTVPYFVYRNGTLVLDNSFRSTSAYRRRTSSLVKSLENLADYSRILQLGHQFISTSIARAGEASDMSTSLDDMVYRPPTDPRWKEAWRITDALLVMMSNEVHRRGVRFLVALEGDGIQTDPHRLDRLEFMNRMGITSLFYPDEHIEALGSREGFEVVDLARPMQAYADSHQVALHYLKVGEWGHWNALGHRVAAQLIDQNLCQDLRNGRR